MKRLILFILVLLTVSLQAKLGYSKANIKKVYKRKPVLEQANLIMFKLHGTEVRVTFTFTKGKCTAIAYTGLDTLIDGHDFVLKYLKLKTRRKGKGLQKVREGNLVILMNAKTILVMKTK